MGAFKPGIDPLAVVGAIAAADSDLLCASCASKEETACKLDAMQAHGQACARCGVAFPDEVAIYREADLMAIAIELLSGRHVLAPAHSVGPLPRAVGPTPIAVIAEPHGQIVYQDFAADVFEAARVFLAHVMARQTAPRHGVLQTLTASELQPGDLVYELALSDFGRVERTDEDGIFVAGRYVQTTPPAIVAILDTPYSMVRRRYNGSVALVTYRAPQEGSPL
jgi:hypothetical protein